MKFSSLKLAGNELAPNKRLAPDYCSTWIVRLKAFGNFLVEVEPGGWQGV